MCFSYMWPLVFSSQFQRSCSRFPYQLRWEKSRVFSVLVSILLHGEICLILSLSSLSISSKHGGGWLHFFPAAFGVCVTHVFSAILPWFLADSFSMTCFALTFSYHSILFDCFMDNLGFCTVWRTLLLLSLQFSLKVGYIIQFFW